MNCPKCKSDNLEWLDSGAESDSYYYEFKCLDCGQFAVEWCDIIYSYTVKED